MTDGLRLTLSITARIVYTGHQLKDQMVMKRYSKHDYVSLNMGIAECTH